MTKPVHPKSAHAAQAFARQHFKSDDVTVRQATGNETLQGHLKGLDLERAIDVVVVGDKRGRELLLTVEDQNATRHLNQESALAIGVGLIPVVGPYLAGAIALKDVVKASFHVGHANLHGVASAPRDRAMLRMGLKHLGLSAISMASHGAAHHLMVGVEAVSAGKDLVDSKDRNWKSYPRALWSAVTSLFAVRGHNTGHDPHEDLRVVLVRELATETTRPVEEKGQGNPESTGGSPAGS